MSRDPERARTRPGWERDPELPESLDEPEGPLSGSVGLPLYVFWSGSDPQAQRWDLGDPDARRSLYEIVLAEGGLDDVRRLVNGAELVRIWHRLYLPPWIRAGWEPLVTAASSAASLAAAVALDPLHEQIAQIALALPEARSLALAGGGATGVTEQPAPGRPARRVGARRGSGTFPRDGPHGAHGAARCWRRHGRGAAHGR